MNTVKPVRKSSVVGFIIVGFFVIVALTLYFTLNEHITTSGDLPDDAPLPTPAVTKPISFALPSTEAFPKILAAVTGWAADSRIISCSGTPQGNNPGLTAGYFDIWTCFVYSASLHSDTTVIYNLGMVTVNPPHLDYAKLTNAPDPKTRNYFSIKDLVSSAKAYRTAQDNGFADTADYAVMGIGLSNSQQKYGGLPVWEVREMLRNHPETIVRIYYINATNGLLLSVTNQ